MPSWFHLLTHCLFGGGTLEAQLASVNLMALFSAAETSLLHLGTNSIAAADVLFSPWAWQDVAILVSSLEIWMTLAMIPSMESSLVFPPLL